MKWLTNLFGALRFRWTLWRLVRQELFLSLMVAIGGALIYYGKKKRVPYA